MSPAPAEHRFLLVRHGETEGQSSVRYHGSNDVPLSDLGRTQIRRLVPLLQACGAPAAPAVVLHSPLQRAAESARILVEGCGWPQALLRPVPDLRELCFGDCEGLTAEEIAARYAAFWREHQAGSSTAFPGGEPFQAFRDRVRAAFAALCQDLPQGDVLVVAHRGVVRNGLCFLLGVEAAAGGEYAVGLGSLSIVRGRPPGRLEGFDLRPEPGPPIG